jgi:GTPase SAR1 family protein
VSGSNEYSLIRNEFHSNCNAILLCFDVSNPESFSALDEWMIESKQHSGKPQIIALIACKIDSNRLVTEAQAKQYAKNRGYLYYETSAKEGTGVNEMFISLFSAVVTALPKE